MEKKIIMHNLNEGLSPPHFFKIDLKYTVGADQIHSVIEVELVFQLAALTS